MQSRKATPPPCCVRSHQKSCEKSMGVSRVPEYLPACALKSRIQQMRLDGNTSHSAIPHAAPWPPSPCCRVRHRHRSVECLSRAGAVQAESHTELEMSFSASRLVYSGVEIIIVIILVTKLTRVGIPRSSLQELPSHLLKGRVTALS